MVLKVFQLLFLYIWFVQIYCMFSDSYNTEEYSRVNNGPCMDESKMYALPRHNPVKIGYVQDIDLGKIGKRSMITKALRPPIFEIPDFLSEEECDFIMNRAVQQGMENSVARGGLTPKLTPILPDNGKTCKMSDVVTGILKPNELGGQFEHWDRDKNGVISILEIIKFARKKHLLFLTKEDILDMINKLDIVEAQDGKITREEFPTTNILGIDAYFYKLHRLHPKHRDRYSEQTWVRFGQSADKTMTRILKRVMKLTKLPSHLVYGGEEMQVVRYQPYGHYHAHFDSETHTREGVPCCHQSLPHRRCKLCRYITVLYYLNDDYKGGETAFPLADNITLDLSQAKSREEKDMFNLNEYCHAANLVVKAKKRGTAVLWYNHKRDHKNGGWLGELDGYSLHGGCMVTEGEKWIANNWLTAPYHHDIDTPSIFLSRFEGYGMPE